MKQDGFRYFRSICRGFLLILSGIVCLEVIVSGSGAFSQCFHAYYIFLTDLGLSLILRFRLSIDTDWGVSLPFHIVKLASIRPIFCGNFEYDARSSEIERLFVRYGKVDRVDMKSGTYISLA